jgi:hypothetical protein
MRLIRSSSRVFKGAEVRFHSVSDFRTDFREGKRLDGDDEATDEGELDIVCVRVGDGWLGGE